MIQNSLKNSERVNPSSETKQQPTYSFFTHTDQGYNIKVAGEVLKNTIKNGPLSISAEGIKSRSMDAKGHTLVDMFLRSGDFLTYKCKEVQHIGVNFLHFHRMMKLVKKKSGLKLSIDVTKPLCLNINPERIDSDMPLNTRLKISRIQPEDIEIPDNYGNPITVKSKDFQEAIKLAKSIIDGKSTTFSYHKNSIKVYSDGIELYDGDLVFGTEDESNTEEDYIQTYNTAKLAYCLKAAGLSPTTQIYMKKGLPLKIHMNLGYLGYLDVYIKSVETLEEEAKQAEDEEAATEEKKFSEEEVEKVISNDEEEEEVEVEEEEEVEFEEAEK
jgi:hypothetical protein